MTRKEIIEILKAEGFSANKMFGQNFLCEDSVTEKIILAADVSSSDRILEIGPGLGELTEKLLSRGCHTTSVEIDSGLFRFLSRKFINEKNLELIHDDFLKTSSLGTFNKVVANLPYYCASEILFKCSELYSPEIICVMLQKEMAERISAKAGTESYGAMTVGLGYNYDSKIAFNVHPASFFPQPDVTSSVLLLKRSNRFDLSPYEIQIFSLLVKGAFWGRRKTFVKACSSSPHISVPKPILLDALSSIGVNAAIRGEELSIEQFVLLSRFVALKGQIDDFKRL